MSKHDPPPGDGDTPGEGVTLKRLCFLLEAYGARPDRWPEGERAPAEALLARFPTARALAGGEASLDDLLDHAAAPAPSEALRARVLGLADASTPVAHPAAPPVAGVVALRRPAGDGAPALVRLLGAVFGGPILRPVALAATFAAGIVVGVVTSTPAPARLDYLHTVAVAEVTGGATEIIVSELLEDELWPIDGFTTLALR